MLALVSVLSTVPVGCLEARRLTGNPDPDTLTREDFIDEVTDEIDIETVETDAQDLVCRYVTNADARHEVDVEMETIANGYVAAVRQDTTFERLVSEGLTEEGLSQWYFYVETKWALAFRTGEMTSQEFADRVIETLEEA